MASGGGAGFKNTGQPGSDSILGKTNLRVRDQMSYSKEDPDSQQQSLKIAVASRNEGGMLLDGNKSDAGNNYGKGSDDND
ncbi:unnamed protein product [Rotaria sp. Silwood1]|nr:unnamed protein product [Rotaria sp. Silwood1]CAF1678328.1 unnamed protein product [Rotaria sp. Silwood1]